MPRRSSRRNALDEENLYEELMQEELQQKVNGPKKQQLDIKRIEPLTENQKRTFEEYYKDQHLVLHGVPGSGKSFIALYLALKDVLNKKYAKLIIARSVVPSRALGFLPGSIEEKIDIYKAPYISLCAELFGFQGAFEQLVKRGIIEFTTTSFLRGLTFDYSVILADECQNFSFQELDTLITRTGKESKIIFSGDYEQRDLRTKNDVSGLLDFMGILETMDEVSIIDFGVQDIVRSGFVKNYILAKLKLEDV